MFYDLFHHFFDKSYREQIFLLINLERNDFHMLIRQVSLI